ncbi:MAG: SlyX family protein [Aeoliella sp.]
MNFTDPDRQTQLEELLAHQQHLIDALNSVVTEQRLEMDALQQKVTRLEEQMRGLAQSAALGGDDLPHEKPPHY